MKMKTFQLAFLCLVLSGCGLGFECSRAKILGNLTDARYGPPPPADHRLTEKKLLLERLKSPEGAAFTFEDARKEIIAEGFVAPKVTAAWVSVVNVYSPGTTGGASPQTVMFAWKYGEVIAATYTVSTDLGDASVWYSTAK